MNSLEVFLQALQSVEDGNYKAVFDVEGAEDVGPLFEYVKDCAKKLNSVKELAEKKLSHDFNKDTISEQLLSVAHDTRNASEEILAGVDKVGHCVNVLKKDLQTIVNDAKEEKFSLSVAHMDRLREHGSDCEEVSHDIITSLEFKDISGDKLRKIITQLHQLGDQVSILAEYTGAFASETDAEKSGDSKELLQDQSLVNKLLQEFGL